jgi:phosphoribosylglycinamide formyltransferase-1
MKNNTKKIIFLCSGNGGNIKFFYQLIESGVLEDKVELIVIADRQCGALEFARIKKLNLFLINFNLESQLEFLNLVKEINPDLIITNIHKILSEEVVKNLSSKLINLHYSILPAFHGLIGDKTVKKSIDYGSKIIGTTVHYVTLELDLGTPVVQSALSINSEDQFNDIMNIIFRLGCISLYTAYCIKCLSKKITRDKIIKFDIWQSIISPGIKLPLLFNDKNFWSKIK